MRIFIGHPFRRVNKTDLRNKIKKLLEIPEQYMTINIIPVGYPKEKPIPHTDKDFNAKKIHREKW